MDNVSISSDSLQIGNVVTGSDGYFAFAISSTKKMINLTARKQNYESDTQMLNIYELSESHNRSIDFQLLRSSIVYIGMVSDSVTQQPLPNVKVHAKIQNGASIESVGTVFTDDNGLYKLELSKPPYESWKYYITADADRGKVRTYTLSHTQVDIGKDFVLNFQL